MNKSQQRTNNEVEVIRLLNQMDDTSVEHSAERFGKYCAYDGFGVIGDTKVLIEVKQRYKSWIFPWIEKQKIIDLFNVYKIANLEGEVYLVNSIEETGEHLLYNAKDIWVFGKHKTEKMNHRTDFKGKGKIDKDIIEFDKNSYVINLTNMELGYKYENKN